MKASVSHAAHAARASHSGPVAQRQPATHTYPAHARPGLATPQALAASPRQAAQRQAQPSHNSLFTRHKSGIDNPAGQALADAQAPHHPAQLQAHAYAQGSAIHLAPGQENHLPHEAWHVAQQAQGRGRPTRQLKGVGSRGSAGLKTLQRHAAPRPGGSTLPMRATVAQLGKKTKAERARDKVGSSKGKLSHKRSRTTFGYLNRAGKARLQGPHTVAHITTSAALAVGSELGRDMSGLLNTKLIPRPRIANRLLRQVLSQPGGQGLTKTRKQRTKYLRDYSKLYANALKEKNPAKQEKLLHRLLEMHPVGTYNVHSGTASPGEMAGKGERRNRSVKDLELLGGMKKGGPLPKGLKTYDGGTALTGLSQTASRDRARQLGRYANDDDLSDAEEYGSDDDSDVDMDM